MAQAGLMGLRQIPITMIAMVMVLMACGPDTPKVSTPEKQPEKPRVQTPLFDQDSAYQFVADQVAFGPRVPGSEAHKACGDWLVEKLSGYGLQVLEQEGTVKAFNGVQLPLRNIIAQHAPEKQKRILLFAHWDTRPFADHSENDKSNPIDGANDGGSGVGVLLEVARQISLKTTNAGIDIIFFDVEDYGQPSGTMLEENTGSWCLGSQYWGKNPPIADYKADFGILLDMVGAKDAVFPKEAISMKQAPQIVNKVWRTAEKLGYGNRFLNETKYFVGVDDHQYVNDLAGIPSIDIIQCDMERGTFGSYWHTHEDNMDVIDRETLKAVGQTVLEVVYQY